MSPRALKGQLTPALLISGILHGLLIGLSGPDWRTWQTLSPSIYHPPLAVEIAQTLAVADENAPEPSLHPLPTPELIDQGPKAAQGTRPATRPPSRQPPPQIDRPAPKPLTSKRRLATPDRQRQAIFKGSGGSPKTADPQGPGALRTSARTGASQDHQDPKTAESDYLSALLKAIAQAQRYPEEARRRGQMGVVVVAFNIQADGRFSAVRILRGSGHEQLDEAAVSALKRLGRFQPLPPALNRSSWSVQLPIRFRLD